MSYALSSPPHALSPMVSSTLSELFQSYRMFGIADVPRDMVTDYVMSSDISIDHQFLLSEVHRTEMAKLEAERVFYEWKMQFHKKECSYGTLIADLQSSSTIANIDYLRQVYVELAVYQSTFYSHVHQHSQVLVRLDHDVQYFQEYLAFILEMQVIFVEGNVPLSSRGAIASLQEHKVRQLAEHIVILCFVRESALVRKSTIEAACIARIEACLSQFAYPEHSLAPPLLESVHSSGQTTPCLSLVSHSPCDVLDHVSPSLEQVGSFDNALPSGQSQDSLSPVSPVPTLSCASLSLASCSHLLMSDTVLRFLCLLPAEHTVAASGHASAFTVLAMFFAQFKLVLSASALVFPCMYLPIPICKTPLAHVDWGPRWMLSMSSYLE